MIPTTKFILGTIFIIIASITSSIITRPIENRKKREIIRTLITIIIIIIVMIYYYILWGIYASSNFINVFIYFNYN